MSKVCDICGKHPVAGRSISHSHRVSNRMFRPNVQKITVLENGHPVKKNVCTQCMRSGTVTRASARPSSRASSPPSRAFFVSVVFSVCEIR